MEIQPVAALDTLISEIADIPNVRVYGRVTAVLGMLIEVGGAARAFSVGDRCTVVARDGHEVLSEVIGSRNGHGLLTPFQPLEGIGLGCPVGQPFGPTTPGLAVWSMLWANLSMAKVPWRPG